MKYSVLILFLVSLVISGCNSIPNKNSAKPTYDFSLITFPAYKSNVAVSYSGGSQGAVKPTYRPVYIDNDQVPAFEVSGYAVFSFKIDQAGKSHSLKMLESSENGLANDLLLNVFSKWLFVPIAQPEKTVQYKFIYVVNPEDANPK